MTVARILAATILLIIIGIAACSASKNSNPSTPGLTPSGSPNGDSQNFEGYLQDEHGIGLGGVEVAITDPHGNPLGETLTNSLGHFQFDLDPNQGYFIYARNSSSGSGGSGWQYSPSSGNGNIPGNPSDGGCVDPTSGYRIWVSCGGNLQPAPSPSIEGVDLGIGGPVQFSLRSTNCMQKILPSTDLESLGTSIRLEGARGEHEAFQIVPVLIPSKTSMAGVEVAASDLVSGGNRIDNGQISIFLEHYVNVVEASDQGGAVGLWPDALVPHTTPFIVSNTMPLPLWIDVEIPINAVPGVYNGQISFSTADSGNLAFQYTLEVWNITFPKKLYMKANIGLDQEDIAEYHNLETGLLEPSGRAMARIYAEFLAERGISTHGVPVFQPTVTVNPDNRGYSINYAEMQTDIDLLLTQYDLSNFHFPLDRFDILQSGFVGRGESPFTSDFNARFIDYTQKVSTYLSTKGYLDRSFIWFIDEPNSCDDYDLVRDYSNLLRQASIYPDYMVTEQPAPEDDSWGSLHDNVDIFTSEITRFYFMGSEAAAREGGQDREEWLYTNTNVYPFPSYSIDKQGMETRLFEWFAYQSGFDGIFYFSATNWTTANPWINPLGYGTGYGNGCGCLIYPGTICNTYTGQDNVNGPVGSIRLELIRQGLEDAQLLYLAGNGNPVSGLDDLMTGWLNYSHDPEELLAARRSLADSIM
jgi:hypothetical protein